MPNDTTIETVGNRKRKTRVAGRRQINNQQYSIETVPQKLKYGFIGMNRPASEELKIGTNLKYNEIIVVARKGEKLNNITIHHELIEQHLMRYGKLKYKDAHKVALRFEDTDVSPKEALQWYKNNKKRK